MPNHHHHPDDDADGAALAELLDLDAEVLSSYLSDATAWVQHLANGRPGRRILDLGCGTGTGTVALAQRFPAAEVIAVDQSAEMLARVQAKARDLGLADRIHAVEADLDQPWPAIGAVDVVWTSMALHHLTDPGRALAEIYAIIRPGGLLAVAEMTSLPSFLPEDIGLGRPGLEARCRAAMAELNAAAGGPGQSNTASLPYLGADWGPPITQAGFTAVAERTFTIDLTAPLPAAAGRYAQGSLRRTRAHLDGSIADDDLAALGLLIDGDGPHSVLRRQDLAIRGERTLWTATRP